MPIIIDIIWSLCIDTNNCGIVIRVLRYNTECSGYTNSGTYYDVLNIPQMLLIYSFAGGVRPELTMLHSFYAVGEFSQCTSRQCIA